MSRSQRPPGLASSPDRPALRRRELTVVGVLARGMKVRHGVVRVVLVLPPTHAEPFRHVAPEHARQVTVETVLEHLRGPKTAVTLRNKTDGEGLLQRLVATRSRDDIILSGVDHHTARCRPGRQR